MALNSDQIEQQLIGQQNGKVWKKLTRETTEDKTNIIKEKTNFDWLTYPVSNLEQTQTPVQWNVSIWVEQYAPTSLS